MNPVRKNRRRAGRLSLLLLCVVLLLAGCEGLPQWVGDVIFTPTAPLPPTPTQPAQPSPQPNPSATPVTPDVNQLTIWLPPDMDPAKNTRAGQVLNQRLEDFTLETGIEVEVRLKGSNGPGGLMESLEASRAAAPLTMPAVTILSRTDLEAATARGLLYPIDDLPVMSDESDWYPYARQLSRIGESIYGVPLGGDALALIYRNAAAPAEVNTWTSLVNARFPVIFAANHSSALFPISLYQAYGGRMTGTDGQPAFDTSALQMMMEFVYDSANKGVFPPWINQLDTDAQAWTAFKDGRADAVITWASTYLSQIPPDSTLTALPLLQDTSVSFATGWLWAIPDPYSSRRENSRQLVTWLSDPAFLAEWSEALALLPTRPSALAGWENDALRSAIAPIVQNTRLPPRSDLLGVLGPIFRDTTISVIRLDLTPQRAVDSAIEKLNSTLQP